MASLVSFRQMHSGLLFRWSYITTYVARVLFFVRDMMLERLFLDEIACRFSYGLLQRHKTTVTILLEVAYPPFEV